MVEVLEKMLDRLLLLESVQLWSLVGIWVTLALAVAGIASGKGQSAGGFFLFALVLSPLLGMIFVVLVPDEKGKTIAALQARLDAAGVAAPSAPYVHPGQEAKSGSIPVAAWVVMGAAGVAVFVAVMVFAFPAYRGG